MFSYTSCKCILIINFLVMDSEPNYYPKTLSRSQIRQIRVFAKENELLKETEFYRPLPSYSGDEEIFNLNEANSTDPMVVEKNLRLLRARWQTFKNMPRQGEANNFPSGNEKFYIDFNAARIKDWQRKLAIRAYLRDDYQPWIERMELIKEAWEDLRCAKNKRNTILERRIKLSRLRDIIGDEAFYRGEIPLTVGIKEGE